MTDPDTKNTKQLVVVGSSAGGIEALSILVSSLDRDFSAPVVLAQHLDPTRPSHLGPILERKSPLPIVTVGDDTLLEAGKVYVVPSNQHVVIRDGHVSLEKDHGNRPRPSVDLLLSSAARAYGERLIAVILTGSGSDGAAGAIEVKDLGGTVIIQNPSTAAHPSMPLALPPTAVDHVADIQQIGSLLHDIVEGVALPEHIAADTDDALAEVLSRVARHANIDFRQYKSSTLLRRIGRRMAVNHLRTLQEYRDFLDTNGQETSHLVKSLLIKVTEFFRDSEAFTFLEQEVLPLLIASGRERGRVLRLWSAGCATGEEAYSLALILSHALGSELPDWSVKVFATDVDEDAIDFARRGLYPANVLAQLPEAYRKTHFEPADHGFRVNKALRQMVIFGQQDLSRGVPFPRIDLVVCRNLLIYFKPDLQQEVLDLFAYSLHNTHGYLFLGKAETARPSRSAFDLVHKKWKVYRCISGPIPVPARPADLAPRDALSDGKSRRAPGPEGGIASAIDEPDLTHVRRASELLLRFLPVGIAVIDRSYRIFSLNGSARRLLGVRDAGYDQDFLHAARGLPYTDVRGAIDRVFQERMAVTLSEIELGARPIGEGQFVTLHMAPLQGGTYEFVIINIIDVTDLVRTKRGMEALQAEQQQLTEELGTSNRRFIDVNRELQDANEELQASNEEMMLAQEELQATNEEFEATNEELQATNEELETNNEEMQATNEELQTTNDELQARTVELQELTRVLSGERLRLSEVVEKAPFHIAVLRGPKLLVESINPPSGTLFAALVLGQPFGEIGSEGLESVRAGAQRAYLEDTPWSSERLRIGPPGHEGYYVFSAVPMRTHDGSVDGVVIYAEDVTTRIDDESKERLGRLKLMLEHAEQVVMALFDVGSRRLLHASQRYFEVLLRYQGLDLKDVTDRSWDELWIGPGDADAVFNEVVQTGQPRRIRELRLGVEPDTTVWDVSVIPIERDRATFGLRYIMLIAVEVTAPVMARDEVERLDRLRDEFLSLASHELRTPLTPLSAFTEVMERLLQQPRDEKWEHQMQHVIGKFRTQIRFLSRLTEDLLDISRLQSGKFSLEMKPVSLRQIVREAKEQAAAISAHPPIMLDEPKKDELRVAGDDMRLTQTVLNLLSNALRHASDGSKIELRSKRVLMNGSARGRVEVRDFGSGIKPEERDRLFTKFYQANARGSSRPGLGLGLYISSRIIEQHGGTIGAEFHQPGTTFWVELPLLDA